MLVIFRWTILSIVLAIYCLSRGELQCGNGPFKTSSIMPSEAKEVKNITLLAAEPQTSSVNTNTVELFEFLFYSEPIDK